LKGQVFKADVQHSAQVMDDCVEKKITIASEIPKTMLILN
jgi:hypothetical protein